MTGARTGGANVSGSKAMSTWTPERVKMLLDIWPQGFSASQTAAMIGGLTRCAVIGKVHRMGLPTRPQDGAIRCTDPNVLAKRAKKARDQDTSNKRARRAKARAIEGPSFKASASQPVEPVVPYDGSLSVPFASLGPSQCRFIEGEAPERLSCGNETSGGSWCAHHRQIVWVKPEHRRATNPDGNRRGVKVSNFVGSHEAA